jgi:hypothetical protein
MDINLYVLILIVITWLVIDIAKALHEAIHQCTKKKSHSPSLFTSPGNTFTGIHPQLIIEILTKRKGAQGIGSSHSFAASVQ